MTQNAHAAPAWERASWVVLLAAFVGATTAVSKLPFLPDTTPVTERFTGAEFLALTALTAVALGMWLVSWVSDGRRTQLTSAHPALLALAATVIVAATGAAVRPLAVVGDSGRYMGMTTWLCCALLFFLATQLVTTPQRMRTITFVFIAVGAIQGLLGVSQVVGMDIMRFQFPPDHQWMLSQGVGTIGNPNQFSSVLVIPFVLACAEVWWARDGRQRAFFAICATIMALALVTAATRGAWVGAFVGLVGLVLIVVRCKVATARTLLVATAAVVIVVLAGLAIADQAIMATRFDTDAPDQSAIEQLSNGRFTIWRQSASLFSSAPVVGVGPDSIRNALKASGLTTNVMGLFTDDPHSLPLLIAVSFGISGLLASVWLLVAVLAGPIRLAVARQPQCPPAEGRMRAHAWVAALLGLFATSLVSVLSIPMLTSLFVALGILHAPAAARPQASRVAPVAIAAVSVVLATGFAAISLWASIPPVYHNLRIDRAPLATPLPTHSEEVLDEADRALPWRYDTMLVRTSWLLQQAGYEYMQGDNSEDTGIGRYMALRAHTDARVQLYPGDFFAWLMRARSYLAVADVLRVEPEGLRYAEEATAVVQEALKRFPNDPELLEIARLLRTL